MVDSLPVTGWHSYEDKAYDPGFNDQKTTKYS